jgi:2-polyprenyl-3-methyl-5-hydroxy-6-metoxy-1,4-benzoquinol methylase
MSNYKDYGYQTEDNACAHSYLIGTLLPLLDKSRNKTILDVGCGNGSMASFFILKGFNVYGTDASPSGIGIAKQRHPDRFFIQDLSSDDLPPELQHIAFDTIISTEVIEHLYDPKRYLKFCKQVLLKNGGGELIISTPYHGYLKNLVLALTNKFDTHFTTLWDGGHIKFWSRKTLIKILEEYGFKILDFKGSGRIPYVWKSMVIKAKI